MRDEERPRVAHPAGAPAPTRRRRAALLASCGVAAAHQLFAHAIMGGGNGHSPGGCRTLEGGIGETAVGVSTNAD